MVKRLHEQALIDARAQAEKLEEQHTWDLLQANPITNLLGKLLKKIPI